jgi:hypothetical protein
VCGLLLRIYAAFSLEGGACAATGTSTLLPGKSPKRRNHTVHSGAKVPKERRHCQRLWRSEEEQQCHDGGQREAVVGEDPQTMSDQVVQEKPYRQVSNDGGGDAAGGEE